MRLFVALDIPDETRDALASVIARLRPKCPAAKWVRPETMHVTLKFIGHVADDRLEPIRAALATIHAPAAIDLQFRGLGFFPNDRRPRVFWAGVGPSRNAAALAASIDESLGALGISQETRPFAPHLTLARLAPDKLFARGKPSPQLAEILNAARDFASADFGATRASEFHLFESKLKPSGAEYTRLQTYAFVRPGPVGPTT